MIWIGVQTHSEWCYSGNIDEGSVEVEADIPVRAFTRAEWGAEWVAADVANRHVECVPVDDEEAK